MSSDSASQLDVSCRPATYFRIGLDKQLLAKVKGAERRAACNG
jgi:hypothetical protein